MWGKVIIDGLKCISLDGLLKYGRDLFSVVATNEMKYTKISEQLKRLS